MRSAQAHPELIFVRILIWLLAGSLVVNGLLDMLNGDGPGRLFIGVGLSALLAAEVWMRRNE